MSLVMDASALLAMIRDEAGADVVEQLIEDNECSVHVLNLCEVYYGSRRKSGEREADEAIDSMAEMGIVPREDIDTEFWKQVGAYKADVAGLSLADCFCLALATRVNGEIVTSDREFDKVVERNLCPVRFIR